MTPQKAPGHGKYTIVVDLALGPKVVELALRLKVVYLALGPKVVDLALRLKLVYLALGLQKVVYGTWAQGGLCLPLGHQKLFIKGGVSKGGCLDEV